MGSRVMVQTGREGGRDVKPSCVALQTQVQMQEVMAKSEMLMVMQNVNPAERRVQGAFCDDCLVRLQHAVLLPFENLVVLKRGITIVAIAKVEGSKIECVEKRLHNK